MRKILHATDFSGNAIPALNYALNLSKKLDASIFVIHVFDYPTIFDKDLKEPYINLEDKTYITQQNKLINFCNSNYEGDLGEVDVSFEAIENKSIINGIIEKAKNLNADLIITGTKSEKLLKELLLGKTALKLIEKAPCPVLTVPKDASADNIKTIVYASDFEEKDISAIYSLVHIAKPYEAAIKIVHVSKKENSYVLQKKSWFNQLLKEKIKYDKIDTEIIFSENIFDSLRNYLADENAGMVAMLERDSKGIVKMLFHSDLVKKMESLGSLPLMSFNGHRM